MDILNWGVQVLVQDLVESSLPRQKSIGGVSRRPGADYISSSGLVRGKGEGNVEEGESMPHVEHMVRGEVWDLEAI
jgi:hypothetical protein